MLIPRLQLLKDKLIQIPRDLGVPTYRNLAVRKKSTLTDNFKDYIFDPVPKIVNLNDRQISELLTKDTIQISLEDFFVKHISRVTNTRESLTKGIEFYIVDYQKVAGQIKGIKCRLIFLDEVGTTSYAMYLKRLSDHILIEPN